MAISNDYPDAEPERDALDRVQGPLVVEFGAPWCGYCLAARPLVEAAFARSPQLPHLRIEDGKGRRLGRSFRVKLWPTLIFIRDGKETGRVVRPTATEEVAQELIRLTTE